MSKLALRTFVEKVLTNVVSCPLIATEKASEDYIVPMCSGSFNIFAGDSRDWVKRNRFHMYPPDKLFFPESIDQWYFERKYYWDDDGIDCCSNYSISFHYIYPRSMYRKYFLTYHLKTYGIKYRHPPLPKRANMTKVIETLEMERLNPSLRGYN